ncbi:hypothetical protein [Yinghuangia soli]|uniref:Uncharacterized protein n=1 Tax=Yinghuangia soli TaxID=2908204 RepID=A0AA41Q9M9_9ACTN|nr:hypothetical protein [Yinghuangia soli]MCF2533316.1 hypothetical protein [Yinghuangia soli]
MSQSSNMPEELAGQMPRQHHYGVAHVILPKFVLEHGMVFATFALSGRLESVLHEMWAEAASVVPRGKRVAPDGLGFRLFWGRKKQQLVLITFPPPQKATEAHFAAVFFDRSFKARYFTLERTVSEASADATVLGEWTAAGHANLGGGPVADPEAFVKAVGRLVRVRRWKWLRPDQYADQRSAARIMLGMDPE